MKKLSLVFLLFFSFFVSAYGSKKNILIINGKSTHNPFSHNNVEVGKLIAKKLEDSKYGKFLNVDVSFKYPEDLSLVENADLVIISSDGGKDHALMNPQDPTKDMKHLDSVLKKGKTGLIVIHWATDAPSGGYTQMIPENTKMMDEWIGAHYHWVNGDKDPKSSWTWQFPVLKMEVNSTHPISNGVEDFKLQDEYYFNFFNEGDDARNPVSDRVTVIHSADAPSHKSDMDRKRNWRDQPVFWAYDREDGGRSVAMTSAHFYHTWANPHFFKSVMNSVFWTMGATIPRDGMDVETPTFDELLSIGDNVQIWMKAKHFK